MQEGNLVIREGQERPAGNKIVLLPNRFDRSRGHLAIFNWGKSEKVEVPVKGFLKDGDSFRLMDPEDFFGDAIVQGVYRGDSIEVPVKGEFVVFVVLRN